MSAISAVALTSERNPCSYAHAQTFGDHDMQVEIHVIWVCDIPNLVCTR